MSREMKPAFKFILIVLPIFAVLFGGYWLNENGHLQKIIPTQKKNSVSKSDLKDFTEKTGMGRPLVVGSNTWFGYAPLWYMNGGSAASKNSRFYKEHGILVEIKNNDDFANSREQWKSDNVDVMWATADAFSMESPGFADYSPQVFYQFDWSRGGDVIVATRGIKSANDLKGKKISVAFGTPSQSLLINFLQSANLTVDDVQLATAADAIAASAMFQAGQVDAAVTWTPFNLECEKAISGSHTLYSTKQASHIIADVFFAKKSFVESHPDVVQAFVEAMLEGAAQLHTSDGARKEAAQIMAQGLSGVTAADAEAAFGDVRFTTYGDNLEFFGLTRGKSVTGDELYTKMARNFQALGLTKNPPSWRSLANTSFLVKAGQKYSTDKPGFEPEGRIQFAKADEKIEQSESMATKRISIGFATGSYMLDDNAKTIIDLKAVETARLFAAARIRIEGNTDNVGQREANRILSEKRAKSVVDYLVSEYNFDVNRFVVRGNGPDKPIGDNSTAEGRAANRRTDFELLGVE